MTVIDQIPLTRRAREADRDALVAVLAAAFADDPVFTWLVPDADDRRRLLPGRFAAFADVFARHDETFVLASPSAGVAGVAMWAPPGVAPVHDDDRQAFRERLEQLAGEHRERFAICRQRFEAVHPTEPAWYLQYLGVDPVHHGNGFGRLLLREVLSLADGAGEAAYLEATSPRSRALYERLGFRCIADIELPDGPTVSAMWRDPAT